VTTSSLDDEQEFAVVAGEKCPVRLHRPSYVADWLDTSISTVRRLVRVGKLEAVYIGASLRITDSSVRGLARSGTRRSKPRGKK
jgi:hypothetical protein